MLLAFFIYSILTVIVTWPLFLYLDTQIYGLPGHPFAILWRFWNFKHALINNLPQNFTDRLAAPFGNPILDFLDPPLTFGLGKIVTLLTNEVFAYNFLIFISFPLAGIFTYWLVYYLTKSKWASFISGLIFAFSPYHTIHGIYHLTLAQIQYLPLFLLALLMLQNKPNIKRSLFVALTFLLNASSDFYYGYICLLVFWLFSFLVGWFLLVQANKCFLDYKKFLKYLGLSAIFICVFSAIVFFPIFSIKICSLNWSQNNQTCQKILNLQYQNLPNETRTKIPPQRNIQDVLAFSARPWDYFIPSIEHPIFGQFSKNLYDKLESLTNDYRTTSTFPSERTIYLGIMPIILALIAIIYGFRQFKQSIINNQPSRDPAVFEKTAGNAMSRVYPTKRDTTRPFNHSTISFFAFLLLCFFALSLPAFIYFRGIKILFPSYFLFQIFPMFRSYIRMGLMVILMTAVLTGLSSKFIYNKLKHVNNRLCLILTTLISLLILFDFTIVPPFRTTDVSNIPPSYQWVRNQPGDFIIAEYPKDPRYEYEKFFVRVHQKRVFAPFFVSYFDEGITIDNNLWRAIANINNEETVKILRIYGVKYVVIHTKEVFDNYQGTVMKPLTDPIEGLKLIKQFPEAQIFEVVQGLSLEER